MFSNADYTSLDPDVLRYFSTGVTANSFPPVESFPRETIIRGKNWLLHWYV